MICPFHGLFVPALCMIQYLKTMTLFINSELATYASWSVHFCLSMRCIFLIDVLKEFTIKVTMVPVCFPRVVGKIMKKQHMAQNTNTIKNEREQADGDVWIPNLHQRHILTSYVLVDL